MDHVVGAGAGTGGNVVRRFAGKDAWCAAVVASEGLRDTHRPKWVSPIGTGPIGNAADRPQGLTTREADMVGEEF